jgi:hypothetical protein
MIELTKEHGFRDGFRGISSPVAAEAGGWFFDEDLAARSGFEDITSTHEAGHAVAARACGLSIEHATIDPELTWPEKGGCVSLRIDSHDDCKPLREFSDVSPRVLKRVR